MKVIADPMAIILILGSAQSLFLAFEFFRADRGNRRANRLFALFFITLPIANMNGILYRTGLYKDLPFLIGLEPMARILIGPVLYFYVEALIHRTTRLKRKPALHAAVNVVLFLFCLPFFFEEPTYKMMFVDVWLKNAGYTPTEYFGRFWYELAIELQVWIYLGLIWFTVRRYERLIRDTFSSIDSITLAWIRKVIIAFILGLVAGTASHVLFLFVIKFGLMYLFSPLAAVFSVYYVSYKAFHQPDVFLLEKPPLFQIEEIDPRHPKYEKSCISDEESEILMSRLEKAMKEKRPYADPELTLAKLASLLPASPHHLSQLLNQGLKKSFYNYINSYRVEQVMSCLADPVRSDTSILEIAFDCGFNSKSTFNKIFKQHTSLSPSQFRERASKVS